MALSLMAGCRRDQPKVPEPEAKIAELERGLDRQRDADAYLLEVSSWTAGIVVAASPELHERAEAMVADLQMRTERVNTLLDRTRSDRFSGWNSALAAAARELEELKDAHYRALATLPRERREAERQMSERIDGLNRSLAEFRVHVASVNVAGNLEVKRRTAAMDMARREAGDILKDVARAPADNWPYLRRRWDRAVASWEEDHRSAVERLRSIEKAPAAPAGTTPPAS